MCVELKGKSRVVGKGLVQKSVEFRRRWANKPTVKKKHCTSSLPCYRVGIQRFSYHSCCYYRIVTSVLLA